MSTPSRKTMEISLGLLFIVAMAILAFMATRMGSLAGFGDVVVVTVRFDDAAGLVEDAAVKIAGVEIGRVKSLNIDFDTAVAELQLQNSAGVRTDAVVAVKARSLLGEKYVEIQPQGREAPVVKSGDELTAAPSGLALEELASLLGPTIEQLEVEEISAGAQRVLAMVERQEEPLQGIIQRIDHLLARAEGVPFDDPAIYADLKLSLANLREASQSLPQIAQEAEAALGSARSMADSLEPTLAQVNRSAESIPRLVSSLEETLTRANSLLAVIEPHAERLEDLNYAMIRYLLRNEGLLIRMVEREVPQFDPGFEWDDPPRAFTPAQPDRSIEGFPGESPSRDDSGGPMSQSTTDY